MVMGVPSEGLIFFLNSENNWLTKQNQEEIEHV
jgi:hypothetical protein